MHTLDRFLEGLGLMRISTHENTMRYAARCAARRVVYFCEGERFGSPGTPFLSHDTVRKIAARICKDVAVRIRRGDGQRFLGYALEDDC